MFAAVAEEVGQVLPEADFAVVGRYDADRAAEVAGGWSRAGGHLLAGRRSELGGQNVSTLVFETGQPARVDDLADGGEAVTVAARQIGMRSAAGAPISVEGRLWGVMIAASTRENALGAGTEPRSPGRSGPRRAWYGPACGDGPYQAGHQAEFAARNHARLTVHDQRPAPARAHGVQQPVERGALGPAPHQPRRAPPHREARRRRHGRGARDVADAVLEAVSIAWAAART